MRSDNYILFFGFIFSLTIIGLSVRNKNTYASYEKKAIQQINEKFNKNVTDYIVELKDFEELVEGMPYPPSNVSNTKEAYFALRKEFKKVEFLIEYLDKEGYDKTLNGAPLPKLEPKVADPVTLQPKGFQVIDELIAEEYTIETEKEIRKHVKKLLVDSQNLVTTITQKKVTDRQFFEAARQALIRIETLSITGFDTPGTTHGVQDAHTVLSTLKKYTGFYKSELSHINRTDLYKELDFIFKLGKAATKKADFNTFNRLHFTKKIIHPLYAGLLKTHLALDYETIDEVSRYELAVNYDVQIPFESDFLNPFYFVSLENDIQYQDRAALGKLLFYDPILSESSDLACASCHAPDKAFTDGQVTSIGKNGAQLLRNAPTLNYSVFASRFFHDMRATRLEDQFEHVVVSENEFDSDYKSIIEKLAQSDMYKSAFAKAYPNRKKPISSNSIDYALTAYIMQLNAFDNPIDQYFQGKTTTLSKEVQRGYNLFTGKAACATCHFTPLYAGVVPPLFKESESEVLGVPKHKNTPTILDTDLGRGANGLTKEVAPFFYNSFKTPTLRNIELTAPYMHNGVFETLEEVMDFYNKGGGAGQGMALEHQTLAPNPLNLTDQEIQDLITFMKALTDETRVKAPTELPRDFDSPVLNERKLNQ